MEQIQKLKDMIPMEFRINYQYVFYNNGYLAYQQKRISKEEFLSHAVEYLEMTLALEAAMKEISDEKLRNGCIKSGEKYLTKTEMTILMHMAEANGKNEKNKYFDTLWEYYKWIERQEFPAEQLGMYGFVMSDVADYNDSSTIFLLILLESLYSPKLPL